MKQAITINKLAIRGISFEKERLNEQETSLDNLQDSLSTPSPAAVRYQGAPAPLQGEGAGGPRSRVPPHRVGRLRFPEHMDREPKDS